MQSEQNLVSGFVALSSNPQQDLHTPMHPGIAFQHAVGKRDKDATAWLVAITLPLLAVATVHPWALCTAIGLMAGVGTAAVGCRKSLGGYDPVLMPADIPQEQLVTPYQVSRRWNRCVAAGAVVVTLLSGAVHELSQSAKPAAPVTNAALR